MSTVGAVGGIVVRDLPSEPGIWESASQKWPMQEASPHHHCNGIHYNVICDYDYSYGKEVEGVHDQPAARTRAES
jgi:hypothetical protein